MIAGVDENGPCIYHTGKFRIFFLLNSLKDPSGTMVQYEAKGIGAADEGLQTLLHEQYKGVIRNVEKN